MMSTDIESNIELVRQRRDDTNVFAQSMCEAVFGAVAHAQTRLGALDAETRANEVTIASQQLALEREESIATERRQTLLASISRLADCAAQLDTMQKQVRIAAEAASLIVPSTAPVTSTTRTQQLLDTIAQGQVSLEQLTSQPDTLVNAVDKQSPISMETAAQTLLLLLPRATGKNAVTTPVDILPVCTSPPLSVPLPTTAPSTEAPSPNVDVSPTITTDLIAPTVLLTAITTAAHAPGIIQTTSPIAPPTIESTQSPPLTSQPPLLQVVTTQLKSNPTSGGILGALNQAVSFVKTHKNEAIIAAGAAGSALLLSAAAYEGISHMRSDSPSPPPPPPPAHDPVVITPQHDTSTSVIMPVTVQSNIPSAPGTDHTNIQINGGDAGNDSNALALAIIAASALQNAAPKPAVVPVTVVVQSVSDSESGEDYESELDAADDKAAEPATVLRRQLNPNFLGGKIRAEEASSATQIQPVSNVTDSEATRYPTINRQMISPEGLTQSLAARNFGAVAQQRAMGGGGGSNVTVNNGGQDSGVGGLFPMMMLGSMMGGGIGAQRSRAVEAVPNIAEPFARRVQQPATQDMQSSPPEPGKQLRIRPLASAPSEDNSDSPSDGFSTEEDDQDYVPNRRRRNGKASKAAHVMHAVADPPPHLIVPRASAVADAVSTAAAVNPSSPSTPPAYGESRTHSPSRLEGQSRRKRRKEVETTDVIFHDSMETGSAVAMSPTARNLITHKAVSIKSSRRRSSQSKSSLVDSTISPLPTEAPVPVIDKTLATRKKRVKNPTAEKLPMQSHGDGLSSNQVASVQPGRSSTDDNLRFDGGDNKGSGGGEGQVASKEWGPTTVSVVPIESSDSAAAAAMPAVVIPVQEHDKTSVPAQGRLQSVVYGYDDEDAWLRHEGVASDQTLTRSKTMMADEEGLFMEQSINDLSQFADDGPTQNATSAARAFSQNLARYYLNDSTECIDDTRLQSMADIDLASRKSSRMDHPYMALQDNDDDYDTNAVKKCESSHKRQTIALDFVVKPAASTVTPWVFGQASTAGGLANGQALASPAVALGHAAALHGSSAGGLHGAPGASLFPSSPYFAIRNTSLFTPASVNAQVAVTLARKAVP